MSIKRANTAAAMQFKDKFESIEKIPQQFSELPNDAKFMVKDVLNRLSEIGLDESSSNAAAWGVIEANYQKLDNGTWVKKELNPQFSDKRRGQLIPFRFRHEFEGSAQSWIQIFKVGKFSHPLYGDFEITKDLLSKIVKNFETFNERDIMVDYNHGSGMTADPESSKAAGWVRDMQVKKDGLYALIDWTEAAVDYIHNGEFRFISPEWTEQYQDKRNGDLVGPMLLAIALTNRPFLEGMKPVELMEIPLKGKMKINGGESMKLSEKIKERYGLADNANEDDVLRAIEKAESIALSEIRKAVEAKEGETVIEAVKRKCSELDAAIKIGKELHDKLEEAAKNNATLSADLKKGKAIAFADKMILTEKKALPAQRDSIMAMCETMGLEAAEKFYAGAPKLDHFKAHGTNAGEEKVSLNEHEAHVAKILGIDPSKVVALKEKDALKGLQ
jgi:phage I-like protein